MLIVRGQPVPALRSAAVALCCLIMEVYAGTAQARCAEGTQSSCILANGCEGISECVGGKFGRCGCGGEPSTSACSVCGHGGDLQCDSSCQVVSMTCTSNEVCNGCDDNANGSVDEGLYKCALGPFTTVACSSTVPTTTSYTLSSSMEFERDGTTAQVFYAPKINMSWKIFTNPQVSSMNVQFSQVNMAVGDSISLFTADPSHSLVYVPNSSSASNVTVNVAGAGQARGVDAQFYTDATADAPGFGISNISVLCGASGSTTPYGLYPGQIADGLLLGTGDTLFFSIPGGPERIDVVLRGKTSGTDFDLYTRSGSLPEKNIYDQRSASSGSDELITLNGDTTGQTHYIAVTSAAGAGAFRLTVTKAKTSQLLDLKVGFRFAPNTTQKEQVKTSLRDAAKRFYGMTEGQIELRSATLYTQPDWFGSCSCSGGCDICVSSALGRANSGVPGESTIYANEWDPAAPGYSFAGQVIAHELGHGQLALDDEYKDHDDAAGNVCHGDDLCGHTMMAAYSSNNLCWYGEHRSNLKPLGHVCTNANPQVTCSDTCVNTPSDDTRSAWEHLVLSGRVVLAPGGTPDNYSYANFAPLSQKFTIYEVVP